MNEIEQTDSCAAIANGPGALLRATRESKGFSLSDISERLRLNINILQSIEGDEYADGTALVFVRGYLRSYSTLLGLETQKIMEAFESLGLTEVRDFSEFVKPKKSRDGRAQRFPVSLECNARIFWPSIVALTLALTGLLWVYVGVDPVETTPSPEAVEQVAVVKEDKIIEPAADKPRGSKVATIPADTNPQAEALIF